MKNFNFLFPASILLSMTFATILACQNVDKEKVKTEIVQDVKYIATSYCSPEYAPMREDLINKAREKYPQFPSFDICPLIDEHINK